MDMNIATQQGAPEAAGAAAAGREFLAFRLGAEEYGIDILRVQEIRSYDKPTRIANAPAYVKGVINLRGVIVPIVDLRLKFDLGPAHYDSFTVVVVLNIGHRLLGMVVDAVSDVVSLNPSQLREVPELHTRLDCSHLLGIGTVDDRMLILLDIDKLMGSAELGLLDSPVQ
jgi:purine-binding chemotaxis protein CheW